MKDLTLTEQRFELNKLGASIPDNLTAHQLIKAIEEHQHLGSELVSNTEPKEHKEPQQKRNKGVKNGYTNPTTTV
jgi:hypothetical protein